MTVIRETVRDAAVGVGIADTPEGLDRIDVPGCAAVIWRRSMPPGVRAWLDGLDPAALPSTRTILRPDAVHGALGPMFDAACLPDGDARRWLRSDIADLAARFARLMRASQVRLRLQAVTTNACPRFHIDAVRARLICTYRGPGTQYGISNDGEEPRRVFQVATGAPVVLRGSACPMAPPSGLLHRSPPIAGSGETRFVLVLDPVDDPAEAW